MLFRLKLLLLHLISPLFFLIFFNIFFFIYENIRENNFYDAKNLEIVKNLSIISKDSYLKDNFFDIKKFIIFLKKTNSNIYYINFFNEYGELVFSTYKLNKIKIDYIVDRISLDRDFFDTKKYILDRKFQKSNILYQNLFLLKDRIKIKEYTYFCVLNKKIIANIKIGFIISDVSFFRDLLKKIKNFPVLKYDLYFLIFILFYEIIVSQNIANLFLVFKEAINMIINKKYGIDIKISKNLKKNFSDITHNLKILEQKFIEIEILKKDFIAKVTHELRSPLGIIESYLNFIIDEDIKNDFEKENSEKFYKNVDPKERHYYFLKLLDNTNRLKKFINDVLDISRIESKKEDLKKEEVDLKSLLYSIKDDFSMRLKKENIELIIIIDENLKKFYLDKDKIRQLIIILLDNAIKFSFRDTKIEIRVKMLSNKNKIHSILFEISDEGIGIENKNFEKIFDKFEQIKSNIKVFTPREKGTGLGLSIAKKIVENHEGTIWVESMFGKGTTFFVRIPAIFIKK